MEKASSCIVVFPQYADAVEARALLLGNGISPDRISIIGRDRQEGDVAAMDADVFDDDLMRLGVQEANLYCYKCSLHAGAVLLIVSGNYAEIEEACELLEHLEAADVTLHFNNP
jgi:hypothetical protein